MIGDEAALQTAVLVDEVLAHSQRGGFCATGDIQLAEDVADVGFDRRRADDQLCGDLGVVQTFDHQGQHLALALRQVVAGRWRLGGAVDHGLDYRWREGGLAAVGGADGLGQFVGCHILEQVADGSRLRPIDEISNKHQL